MGPIIEGHHPRQRHAMSVQDKLPSSFVPFLLFPLLTPFEKYKSPSVIPVPLDTVFPNVCYIQLFLCFSWPNISFRVPETNLCLYSEERERERETKAKMVEG